ncbi:MAG: hypothetical protein R3Y64_09745 [Peptostreptococcaceae bacterium]
MFAILFQIGLVIAFIVFYCNLVDFNRKYKKRTKRIVSRRALCDNIKKSFNKLIECVRISGIYSLGMTFTLVFINMLYKSSLNINFISVVFCMLVLMLMVCYLFFDKFFRISMKK